MIKHYRLLAMADAAALAVAVTLAIRWGLFSLRGFLLYSAASFLVLFLFALLVGHLRKEK